MSKIMVYVEWEDSAEVAGWQNTEDFELVPSTCESVGWLVRKTKAELVLALNKCNESRSKFGSYIIIPRSAVRAMRIVK